MEVTYFKGVVKMCWFLTKDFLIVASSVEEIKFTKGGNNNFGGTLFHCSGDEFSRHLKRIRSTVSSVEDLCNSSQIVRNLINGSGDFIFVHDDGSEYMYADLVVNELDSSVNMQMYGLESIFGDVVANQLRDSLPQEEDVHLQQTMDVPVDQVLGGYFYSISEIVTASINKRNTPISSDERQNTVFVRAASKSNPASTRVAADLCLAFFLTTLVTQVYGSVLCMTRAVQWANDIVGDSDYEFSVDQINSSITLNSPA